MNMREGERMCIETNNYLPGCSPSLSLSLNTSLSLFTENRVHLSVINNITGTSPAACLINKFTEISLCSQHSDQIGVSSR